MSTVLRVSEMPSAQVGQEPKLDPSDPRVRKLVYSMYRDMLTSRNNEANDILSKEDPQNVKHDLGVGPILETIIRQGSHTSSGGSTPSAPASQAAPHSGYGPPPPPPPMSSSGSIPSVKLSSEVGPHQKGPPSAIQGAMMKDKKPFTYTPGGIDLSEIRSPRMAKRIQMNAAAEGVTSVPQQVTNNSSLSPGGTTYHLPPASIAAMQPQLPIAVFPQGGFNPSNLNKTNKPNDFSPNQSSGPQFQSIPPPPPPPERYSIPSPSPESRVQKFNETHQEAALDARPNGPPLSLASFMKQTVKSPIPEYDAQPYDPREEPKNQQGFQQQQYQHPQYRQQEQSSPIQQAQPELRSPNLYQHRDEQQSPEIQQQEQQNRWLQQQRQDQRNPQIQQQRQEQMSPQTQQQRQEPRVVQIQQQRQEQMSPHIQQQRQEPRVVQIQQQRQEQMSPHIQQQRQEPRVVQIQQRPEEKSPQFYQRPGPRSPEKQPQQTRAQAASRNIGSLYIPPVEQKSTEQNHTAADTGYGQRHDSVESDSEKEKSVPHTPQTPQLNKAPVPWMNSHNKIQAKPQGSPPFIKNSNTPWGQARTIPISFASNDKPDNKQEAPQEHQQLYAAPAPVQRSISPATTTTVNGARVIPIQIEGTPKSTQQNQSYKSTPETVKTPSFGNRISTPVKTPSSPYFMQQVNNSLPNVGGATTETSTPEDTYRQDPMQSKSFRVIQKIANDETQRLQQERKLNLTEGDRAILDKIKSKVDDGSSLHKTAEPRFRGSNIPSKAFQTLRNHLPPSPGNQEQPPSYPIPVQFAPTTHTIPIRMPTQTPPPPAQQYQFPVEYIGSDNPRVPASQQKVSEPKIYMGKNIPSRSFRMLQQMTGEDGPSTSALGSKVGADYASDSSPSFLTPNNYAQLPCPGRLIEENSSSDNADKDETEKGCEFINVPEDFDPNDCNWDPSSYWYYWWYCASHFWNGTEYEFPEGWEASAPSNYCNFSDEAVSIPSKTFRNLQKNFDTVNEGGDSTASSLQQVPGIVVESENNSYPSQEETSGRLNDSDWNRKCSLAGISEIEEDEVEKSNEKDELNDEIKKEYGTNELKHESKIANEKTEFVNEEFKEKVQNSTPIYCDMAEEKTDSKIEQTTETKTSNCELSSSNESLISNIGIVEEPETPTSEGEDSSTLVDEDSRPSTAGLMIEEYMSDDSESVVAGRKDKLSTIDEISENERTLSAAILSIDNTRKYNNVFAEATKEEKEDSESSSSDDEEESTASVIENKSEGAIHSSNTLANTKGNLSESSSSSDDDPDDLDELNTAVTVRLPLTLSFSKSKSYRDIATVLIGDSEVRSCSDSNSEPKQEHKTKLEKQDEKVTTTPKAPVESFTLKLSGLNNTTTECINADNGLQVDQEQKFGSQYAEVEIHEEKDEPDEIDFWGEIMNDKPVNICINEVKSQATEIEKNPERPEPAVASNDDEEETDFWSQIKNEDIDDKISEQKEINFWDKLGEDQGRNKHKVWDTHGTFKFTDEFHEEVLSGPNTTDTKMNIVQDLDSEPLEPAEINEDSAEEESSIETSEEESGNEDMNDTNIHNLVINPNEVSETNKEEPVIGNSSDLSSAVPASLAEEVSDGSSGGTTIGRDDKSDAECDSDPQTPEVVPESVNMLEPPVTKTTEDEKGLEIPIMRQVPISIEKKENSPCNCQAVSEKLTRAENLLWRIERFLQETILLGSENDSGILTDMSRYISDYETDNECEVESRAVTSPKQKETQSSLTKSGSFTRRERLLEKVESIINAEEKLVTFRGTAAERKALNYERAKTHSRLFQLLQEECEREEEDLLEEDEYEENENMNMNILEKTSTLHDEESNDRNLPSASSSQHENSQTQSSASSSSEDQRSRLVPLPIKSYLTTSLSIDSNSSQSGSSGILSPSSPVNRDQLLNDIIHQFQQRHQQTFNNHFRNKRLKHFPSKIFKILQEEFGQEFYDVFDCEDDAFTATLPRLSSTSLPIQINSKEISIKESTNNSTTTKQHKICSFTNAEEETAASSRQNDSKSNKNPKPITTAKVVQSDSNFYNYDIQLNPRLRLGRDPRIPKNIKK